MMPVYRKMPAFMGKSKRDLKCDEGFRLHNLNFMVRLLSHRILCLYFGPNEMLHFFVVVGLIKIIWTSILVMFISHHYHSLAVCFFFNIICWNDTSIAIIWIMKKEKWLTRLSNQMCDYIYNQCSSYSIPSRYFIINNILIMCKRSRKRILNIF